MDEDQRERLQFVITVHRAEMERHQALVGNIFHWTVTIILALGAGVIGFAGSDTWRGMAVQWPLRLTVSAVSIAIAILASVEMTARLRAYDANARVIAKASILLELFRKNVFSSNHEAIYPDHWKNWGDRNHPATKFAPWFQVVVLIVVAVGIIAIAWTI